MSTIGMFRCNIVVWWSWLFIFSAATGLKIVQSEGFMNHRHKMEVCHWGKSGTRTIITVLEAYKDVQCHVDGRGRAATWTRSLHLRPWIHHITSQGKCTYCWHHVMINMINMIINTVGARIKYRSISCNKIIFFVCTL